MLLDRVVRLIRKVSERDASGDIVVDSDKLRLQTLHDLQRSRDVYLHLASGHLKPTENR